MKSLGMQINAEDIYSINNSSLKDAVVQFGSGCTAQLISFQGLILTNHHCGFSQIQSLSSLENNYVDNGFWAKNLEDEIPFPGLTVTFIKEITDVTEKVLLNIREDMSEEIRDSLIKYNSDSIVRSVKGKLKASVKSFHYGNKFYLFTSEVFSDVRLVGTPPQSIGKFGGETDNWVWPRHTGDFALFRIYADKENQPAPFSKENVPFTPKKSFPVNIDGVKEGDFIFVFGFPGTTKQYIPSSSLEVAESQTNPNRIMIRDKRIEIIKEEMSINDTINLKYIAKVRTLENVYKKWKGEQLGFKKFDVVNSKRNRENFLVSANINSTGKKYEELFRQFDSLNAESKSLNYANDFYVEAFSGIELMLLAASLKTLRSLSSDPNLDKKIMEDEVQKLKKNLRGFYKNYSLKLDRRVGQAMLEITFKKIDKRFMPDGLYNEGLKNNGDYGRFVERLFSKSMFSDSTKLFAFLDSFQRFDTMKIIKDPAFMFYMEISKDLLAIQEDLRSFNKSIAHLQRQYMQLILASEDAKKIYPEANSTLRISYGKVEGVAPVDGLRYNYNTTSDGILAKADIKNPDYVIPDRLKSLLSERKFGQYGSNNTLPVAFIASAHTTGGNSGSPVLNARGELVGLNCDRMWEGVLSDYYYDERICRNISVDMRYILYVIEHFGNADRLIQEMNIVQTTKH